jgi:chromosome segregation ATPase
MMSKINSLYQSKEYLENDLEDLKWSLEKERESMHENERKLKERGDEILRQQEENLKLQKNVEHSLTKYEEACQEVSDLKGEIEELKRREREHLESIK